MIKKLYEKNRQIKKFKNPEKEEKCDSLSLFTTLKEAEGVTLGAFIETVNCRFFLNKTIVFIGRYLYVNDLFIKKILK